MSDAPETDEDAPDEVTPEAAASETTTPETAEDAAQEVVVSLWLPQAVRTTFAEENDVVVTEELDQIGVASMILLSTRLSVDRIDSIVGELKSVTESPIVVVVHTGAADVATKLLAVGATTVIGEGNIATAHAVLGNRAYEESALESFADQLGREEGSQSAGDDGADRAHLVGAEALESRLTALSQTGTLPRLGFVRVSGFARATRRLSMDAADLLRRRFSMQYKQVCTMYDSQLYLIGDGEYAVIAETLSSQDLDELGGQLADITTAYTPDPQIALSFSMGHAGPESASDTTTLREIAMRGVEFGELTLSPAIVSAESLTRTLAAASELESIQGVARDLEERIPYPEGHTDRVMTVCADISEAIGFGGRAAIRLKLASQLHLVGLTTAPDEFLEKLEEETATEDPIFLAHPALGAMLVRGAAGEDVAGMIEAQHAHWDGTGQPLRSTNESVHLGARILHTAISIAQWSTLNGNIVEWPDPRAIQKVSEGVDTEFEPAIVDAVTSLWG